MKHIYVADDGKQFDTAEACETYEAKKNRVEEERKKKEIERKRRLKEVTDAYDKYEELARKYYDDYSDIDSSWNSLLYSLLK